MNYVTAFHLMSSVEDVLRVSSDATVAQVLMEARARPGRIILVTTPEGVAQGIIFEEALSLFNPVIRVGELADYLVIPAIVTPELPVEALISAIFANPSIRWFLVEQGDELLGVVAPRTLTPYLTTFIEEHSQRAQQSADTLEGKSTGIVRVEVVTGEDDEMMGIEAVGTRGETYTFRTADSFLLALDFLGLHGDIHVNDPITHYRCSTPGKHLYKKDDSRLIRDSQGGVRCPKDLGVMNPTFIPRKSGGN